LVVLPEAIVRHALETPLLRGLLPIAAGYFPRAEGHRVERSKPLPEAIAILCIGGKGWVQIGSHPLQSVEKDTLVFIPPGQPHAYGADKDEPWSISWAHFRGTEVGGYWALLGGATRDAKIGLPPGNVRRLDFEEVFQRLEQDYTLANLLCAAAHLRVVLTELNRVQSRSPGAVETDQIERTVIWMREHLHSRASLGDLAMKAGLSIAHYSALFHRRTGFAPMDYFLRLKVQHACRLLDITGMRVEEVARAIGYEDPFYFSRLFRRIMGKSPRAYRAHPKG
jgi:AraC-like DNA-binding protein